MTVLVSVVVPTYHRPDSLRACLTGLLAQKYPAEAYEIIVADNAGDTDTRALLEGLSRDALTSGRIAPAIRYVSAAQKPGPAAARNVGWRSAQGAFIAFTDDDCLPEPLWLMEGVRALQAGLDVVRGRVIVPLPEAPTDYEKNLARLASDTGLVTANCFFRRSALAACGGFDEAYTTAWREDTDVFFNALEHSCKAGSAPSARVVHPARKVPWGISLKEQRKSMFNALLFKKYPQLYRQRVQPGPPVRYYAIVLCGAVCGLALLTDHPFVVFITAAAWSSLTTGFIVERLQGTKHSLGHVLEMVTTSMLIPALSVFWRLYGAAKFRVWFL